MRSSVVSQTALAFAMLFCSSLSFAGLGDRSEFFQVEFETSGEYSCAGADQELSCPRYQTLRATDLASARAEMNGLCAGNGAIHSSCTCYGIRITEGGDELALPAPRAIRGQRTVTGLKLIVASEHEDRTFNIKREAIGDRCDVVAGWSTRPHSNSVLE